MKKTLTTLLTLMLMILLGNQVKSQMPDGTIAPDFTLVDINGTTHHLYDYLNSGKTVFIEFSGTS